MPSNKVFPMVQIVSGRLKSVQRLGVVALLLMLKLHMIVRANNLPAEHRRKEVYSAADLKWDNLNPRRSKELCR